MHKLFALLAGLAALAPAAAAADQTFALIVTNNRSASANRPDLQYADDDGARYHRLFRSAAPPENVVLLTRFDRQSQELYPALAAAARPPRQDELRRAAAELAARVASVRAAGGRAQLYFVYAGHGDVIAGRGILDLEDGPIDGAFLEEVVVAGIGADVHHLVLDSCNSFFVLNPRKPGGRRWATPADMAMGFASRHPAVGLLLSTNSEAEVYEWSELESGIFSHEVRSGLSGGADVDGDGRVSYAELAGFIDTANKRVARPQHRPQIFFRGPGGDAGARLWTPSVTEGRKVVLDEGQRRVWIRNDAGERLIDVHKERGEVELTVPTQAGEALTVVELRAPEAAGDRPRLVEYPVEAGAGAVRLAAVEPRPTRAAARGDAFFRELFAAPYGPRAYQAFMEQKQAPAIYGVAQADRERLRHFLVALARSEREDRRTTGAVSLGFAGVFGTVAGTQLITEGSKEWEASAFLLGFSSVWAAGGFYQLYSVRPAERALERFDRQLAAGGADWQAIVAGTEEELGLLATRERRQRRAGAWTSGVLGSLFLGGAIAAVAVPKWRGEVTPGGVTMIAGVGALCLAGAIASSHLSTPTERILRLYREDQDLRLQVGVTPLVGGMALGLSGRF